MKAMILAAGRGSRLRPLTDVMPKPLIPVGELCLIEHSILKLKRAGITDIVINVAYLADKIMRFLGNGARYGVTLEYSYEGEECLGTGGGIFRALTLLGQQPFWLLSADVWSDFTVLSHQLASGELAHLIMVPNPEFHPRGDYGLMETGEITQENPKLTYAGISFLNPSLFEGCNQGKFSLSPLLNQAITRQAISGELYQGSWFNVGTELELARLRNYLDKSPHLSI